MNTDLAVLREQIDQLDADIQRAISQRAELAAQVAKVKAANGEQGDCYRPDREAQVLRSARERNAGPLDDAVMARLVREIMSACLALESPLTVAYLGPEGSYTEAAAFKHFGESVTGAPQPAIDAIFREVEAEAANYGVVPVENSTEGIVNHTLDQFMTSKLTICGEVNLPIHHCLLSNAGSLAAVQTVYAHSQSLAQCREWLEGRLGHAVLEPVASNAEGARLAAAQAGAAAIASRRAADIYQLKVLAGSIEDEPNNTTRFLVIGRQAVAPSGQDRTSLVLSARNQPGALHALLAPFAAHGVSMNRIESRPSRRVAWDYNFFVDIDGHADDAQVAAALAEIKAEAQFFRVLGAYPVAQP